MKSFDFNFSNFMTIGIELELLIIDNKNYLPVSDVSKIFTSIPNDKVNFIKKEYFEQMIEIVSPVFNNIDEINYFFNDIFNCLKSVSESKTVNFYACGTHPLLFNSNVTVVKDKRYLKLQKELQEILKRFLIMGLHIHIGMKSSNHLINSFNTVNYLLPVFLSLSSSSPFFEGRNTGILSYRSIIMDSLPRSGVFEYLNDYGEFIAIFENLYSHGIVKSYNDIWWDVRPRPDLGTLELRICDSIYNIDRIQAIAALLQAVCLNSLKVKQKHFDLQMVKQNKWASVRYSNEGYFMDYNNMMTIKEKTFSLLNDLISNGIFSELKTEKYIKLIEKFVKEPSIAEKMINDFFKTSDLKNVIKQGVLFK
jgi:carboxylate-amine ligase